MLKFYLRKESSCRTVWILSKVLKKERVRQLAWDSGDFSVFRTLERQLRVFLKHPGQTVISHRLCDPWENRGTRIMPHGGYVTPNRGLYNVLVQTFWAPSFQK